MEAEATCTAVLRASEGDCEYEVNFQTRTLCGRGPERQTHRQSFVGRNWWAHPYLGPRIGVCGRERWLHDLLTDSLGFNPQREISDHAFTTEEPAHA